MTDEKTRAIVLRRNEYRAGSALLTLFTENAGILQASAYGIHSMKSGVASASQPLTCSEFTLSHKNGRNTVKSACLLESFGSVGATYDSLLLMTRLARSAALIFGESAHEKPHEPFSLLYTAMSYTAYSEKNADDVYVFFLLKAMSLSGQAPSVTHCAVCAEELYNEKDILFSVRHGGAVCAHCATGRAVSRLSLEAVRRMYLLPVDEINKIVLPDAVRSELMDILTSYLEFWYK